MFIGVPTMYGAVLAAAKDPPEDLASLRLGVSGGSALPVELLRRFEATFDCEILEGYGLSETSPVACFNHPGEEHQPGSIGRAVRGCELQLVTPDGAVVPEGDEETLGEVWIRGENVMKGYWGKPEATAQAITEDGWFRSGDQVTQDAAGYIQVVDRIKDVINTGGVLVAPREVEDAIYELDEVAEVAVIGLPDERWIEAVTAVVVLKEGAELTAETVRAHVKERLAGFKVPKRVDFVAELPRNQSGKLLKRALRAERTQEAR